MPVYPAVTIPPGDPGDLIVSDYQYQFDRLLFGSGTPYVTTKVDGLLSLATIRSPGDTELVNDHGSVPGVMTLGKRVIAFDVTVVGGAGVDIEDKLAVLRASFQLPRIRKSRELKAFSFQRPGGPRKLILCRCTKRDFSSTYEVAHGQAAGSVELTATDPRIYALNPSQQQIILAPGATSGTVTAHNSGDFSDGAFPVIAIQGPWTNPRIQNNGDDGRTIRIDIALTASDVLLIDARARTVMVSHSGGAAVNAFGNLRNDNEWWTMLPGNNAIIATRDAGNTGATGTLTVQWQDTYA